MYHVELTCELLTFVNQKSKIPRVFKILGYEVIFKIMNFVHRFSFHRTKNNNIFNKVILPMMKITTFALLISQLFWNSSTQQAQVQVQAFTQQVQAFNHLARTKATTKSSNVLFLSSSDDDDNVVEIPPPKDMTFTPYNIERQMQNFINIRQVGGPLDTVNDVYVRDPTASNDGGNDDLFWFVGKVARCGTVSIEQTIQRQWYLIEQHACRLRPIELGKKFGRGLALEIWVAPPDSELDVAYNKPQIKFQKIEKKDDYCIQSVKSVEVGFEGEVYVDGEDGFRTLRNPTDGSPKKGEIIQDMDSLKRQATENEMDQLMEVLQSKTFKDEPK